MIVKKGIAIAIIILFIGMSVFPSTANTVEKIYMPTSKGNTLYVGGSGEDNYTKIQDAIDNASDDDTVFVYDDSSPYFEYVEVNKTINLVGENRNTTIIDGSKHKYVINVSSDNVTISNFTIQNKGYISGKICIIVQADYCQILNNNVIKNGEGIILYYFHDCQIINNYIASGYIKIELECSHGNIIRGNKIEGKHKNNVILGDSEKGVFYGIWLINSDNNIIMDNVIYSNDFGAIELYDSNGNLITRNFCNDNFAGVVCASSDYNNVSKNIVISNYYGIFIGYSHKNCIMSNIVNGNYLDGINISFGCTENLFFNNTIESNECHGVIFDSQWSLYSNKRNFVQGNTIKNNKYGAKICGSDNNNSISENNISDNEYGMYIIDSSNDNLIYHNNFINNTYQSYDECNNTWDDRKYGNYWSDYEERYPDAKKKWLKGIWDTPYEIPGRDNKDNCPLINQWPKSKPRTIPRNTASYSSYLLRFLEQFPILQKILLLQR